MFNIKINFVVEFCLHLPEMNFTHLIHAFHLY